MENNCDCVCHKSAGKLMSMAIHKQMAQWNCKHCDSSLLEQNSEFPNIPEKVQDEICKWVQRGDEVKVLYIVNKLLDALTIKNDD